MRAPDRLHGLDALRGFAAVSVVIFHWQFWGRDVNRIAPPGGFGFPRAIGEAALSFFYRCGLSAVGLFFTLSGFVFYWLYRDAVRRGEVDGRRFAVDRASRLYPLYFATLVWAWAGHNLYAWMNQGPDWSSGVNDLWGFVRQALVFPLWTPHRVIGFNLPSWSLAVEALMYVLFFVLARRAWLGVAGTIAMVALASLVKFYSEDIGYGMASFFMGGLAFLAFERADAARVMRPLGLVLGASWFLAIVFGSGVLDLAATPLRLLDHHFAVYVLFPATVLYLALAESIRGPIAPGLGWFGDATYSIYLLHFPLMLTVAIAMRASGGDFQKLQSPWSLAAFVVAVSLLGVACHRVFERPAQGWIRRRFSGPRRALAVAEVAR